MKSQSADIALTDNLVSNSYREAILDVLGVIQLFAASCLNDLIQLFNLAVVGIWNDDDLQFGVDGNTHLCFLQNVFSSASLCRGMMELV